MAVGPAAGGGDAGGVRGYGNGGTIRSAARCEARKRMGERSGVPLMDWNTERARPWLLLAGIALLIVLAVALAIGGTTGVRRPVVAARTAPPRRAMPAAPPVPAPAVEPLELLEMTPDRARAINAGIPFVPKGWPAARPFRFAGTPADRAGARLCLASAAWYEAGDDPVGQPAVVQVVLNRVRHPAYPKTICGVVFQGAERRTGCQFSFTCDGAMARRPSDVAWGRALGVADKALDGYVDRRVGNATHYHTDWVVPYWSGTLDKIAAVDTHLFFLWRGYWGTPAAFRGRYAGGERVDPRVPGYLVPVTGPGDMPVDGVTTFGVPGMPSDEVQTLKPRPVVTIPGLPALPGVTLRLGTPGGRDFGIEIGWTTSPADQLAAAEAICRNRPSCVVAGWRDLAIMPEALPFPPSLLRVATFVYRKRPEDAAGKPAWNCRQIARADKTECLPGTE